VIRVDRASAISINAAEKCRWRGTFSESSHIGLYFQHEYSSSLFPEFFLALNRRSSGKPNVTMGAMQHLILALDSTALHSGYSYIRFS
jgi:hypothetical protein